MPARTPDSPFWRPELQGRSRPAGSVKSAAMSKAFTRERDDDEEAPVAPEAPLPARNYISPAGFARLQAEKKQLLEVERPEVVRTVSWAAKNGDRSENGDYLYGKKRLREIDRRVRFLIKRMEAAEIVVSARRMSAIECTVEPPSASTRAHTRRWGVTSRSRSQCPHLRASAVRLSQPNVARSASPNLVTWVSFNGGLLSIVLVAQPIGG